MQPTSEICNTFKCPTRFFNEKKRPWYEIKLETSMSFISGILSRLRYLQINFVRFIFAQIASIFSAPCPHISSAYGNRCYNKYTILKKYSIEYTIIRENYHQIWKKKYSIEYTDIQEKCHRIRNLTPSDA